MGHSVRDRRFAGVAARKAAGATYTPKALADFVASQVVRAAEVSGRSGRLRLFDPAVGEGELLVSLAERLGAATGFDVIISGYDTDARALARAEARLRSLGPSMAVELVHGSFLEAVERGEGGRHDLVVANPPYVRTQVMGSARARGLARAFGLGGRVDLSHAFILGIGSVLDAGGVAGIIASNRFLSTRAGASVRRSILERFSLERLWDFGDTRLFDAAVLPAVLVVRPKAEGRERPSFTSIYETYGEAESRASCPVGAVEREGVVEVEDGRRFLVVNGHLSDSGDRGGVWRMATPSGDAWLEAVHRNRWGTFGDVGKVRVGVKTCADAVFIGDDWEGRTPGRLPELLRPLTTHHAARRFRARDLDRPRSILYPHEAVDGVRRAVDLADHPASLAYLERHRAALEARSYVLEAGRAWFEIWVPQDPSAWARPKLVFRDIAEEPTFWLDLAGTVVNGDCYWIAGDEDLLWLASAVGNSKFAAAYYDRRFPNKLYSGRRRFITQYVREFPLPDPASELGRRLIAGAKRAYNFPGGAEEADLETLVERSFGVDAGFGASP